MEKETKTKIRTRIAPSPTGFLHLGTARAALFNYLFAKRYGGNFILRIEDTDLERSDKKYEKDIVENLKWLGIEWSEGPDIGGEYGPYRQSERLERYKGYLEKLINQDKAYYCFCSEEELEQQRQYALSTGEPWRYSGKCATLPLSEVKKYLDEGRPSVIRFRVPGKIVEFNDLIRGKVQFDSNLIGDITIAKNLNEPLYNFAVVIDDFEMQISHVIRGEDHISNTPKQILLQEALELPRPEYAHLPLVLGSDRTKLSKRHGTTSISEYRAEGYLPETLANFMAFLGWNPGDEREIFSIASLIKEFSIEKVQKGGAIFNIQRLDFLNGFYIRQRSSEKLAELCIPYLVENNLIYPILEQIELIPGVVSGPIEANNYIVTETKEKINSGTIKKIIFLHKERLKKLSEIAELTRFFFKDRLEYDKNLLKWKEMSDKEIENSLDKTEKILSKIKEENFVKENLEKILLQEAEKIGNRGMLLWPLRVALSGKEASAGPFEIADILGKEKSLERIKEAKKILKG